MKAELRIVKGEDCGTGNIIVEGVEDVNDLNGDEVSKLIKEALSRGCCRVNIIVETRLTPGEVLGALRPVIKGHVYPSMSVWVVKELSEASDALRGGVMLYG